MAAGLDEIAAFPDPIGRTLARWERPNGLVIARVSVPLGVIGIIYESRPNVTADASALCLKAGNAVILRSGSESFLTSLVIANILTEAITTSGLPVSAIQLVPTVDRSAVGFMLGGLDGAIDVPLGPEARYERTEAISLAFMTALQVLPARQRAVLILREVLGYRASEVADMLDSTVDSVDSLLKRARATLQRRLSPTGERAPAPAPGSPAEQALVAEFVRAYDSGHIDALVALLTADASISMPPIPLEYHGRDAVDRFLASVSRQGRRFDLVPTRANGQLAFGVYLRAPTGGMRHGIGLDVVTLTGDRVCAIARFDSSVLPSFGLPRSLPAR